MTLLLKGWYKLAIQDSYWNMHMTHRSLLVDFYLIVITEICSKLMVLEMFLFAIMDLNQFLSIVSELVIQTSLLIRLVSLNLTAKDRKSPMKIE